MLLLTFQLPTTTTWGLSTFTLCLLCCPWDPCGPKGPYPSLLSLLPKGHTQQCLGTRGWPGSEPLCTLPGI